MTFTATIWDVEHGSAAYAVCPNGKSFMLDAGCSGSFSPAAFLARKQLQVDHLIISHPDQDHINDLPRVHTLLSPRILSRNKTIPPWLIYRGSGGQPETEAKRVYKTMHERYVHPVNPTDQAHPIDNWGGVAHRGYHVDATRHPDICGATSCNNYSLVTVLTCYHTAIVFPGDIEDPGMQVLMRETDILETVRASQFRVLVAPHHGRAAGVSANFLNSIEPSLAIMSDCRGAETTDHGAYSSRCTGLYVVDHATATATQMRVVSTKSNSAVQVSVTPAELVITRF